LKYRRVKLDTGGNERAKKNTFFYGKGNETISWWWWENRLLGLVGNPYFL
jgi:hypothetical protein